MEANFEAGIQLAASPRSGQGALELQQQRLPSPSDQRSTRSDEGCSTATDLRSRLTIAQAIVFHRHRSLKASRGGRALRCSLLVFATVLHPWAIGQTGAAKIIASSGGGPALKPKTDELVQELDADDLALSQVPADPLLNPDPAARIFMPLNELRKRVRGSERLKLGATYTFLDQYAEATPDGVRHDQLSGRLDSTGAWAAYDHGSSAGSISLLVRSGTNIGMSQQFNLSDELGSGLYLNCLQGGGPQEPITVNVLYWREDFLDRRFSFYVGKIHPNQYVSLSMFNNDERTQFLNGQDDGNLTFASDGTYAGGAALELQASSHIYVHTVVVDTEGTQQSNLKTLVDRKYMEAAEVGWSSGSPGEEYRDYRIFLWRDDTKSLGSGYGGGLGFEHEFANGWAPFARYGLATDRGTSIRQADSIGVDQVHPFGRRGDTLGFAFNYTEPSKTGKHHESVFESFYRLRLTQSVGLGPDLEISNHPTYVSKAYATALLGMRMQVIF